jgi:tRNA threonylcarbamoyl adenosine modification protein YjeE
VSETRLVAQLKIETAEAMHELGQKLGDILNPGDLLVLNGPLGAGKTTLTRGIGDSLKTEGTVSSPTFVIARTHPALAERLGAGKSLVHVDAYRLSSPAELDDLDIDYANSITIVEWGAGLTDGIASAWLELNIERDHTGVTEVRELELWAAGDRWAELSASDFGVA